MFNPSKAMQAAALVLVIMALAATLARAIWFFALGPEATQFVQSTPSEAPSSPDVMYIERIVAQNLFGTPRSTASGLDVDAAPDTELDLRLFGIFLATRPETSVAIIGSRGDSGEAYGVGDPIFGNAKVAEIHGDLVLISRAGIMEALRFDDEPVLVSSPTQRASILDSYVPGEPPLAANADVVPVTIEESIEVFRDQLEQDPERTLRAIGLEPVSIDGDTGYRIGQSTATRQLGRTGLQPGDTIMSIDGQPIGDMQQHPKVFGEALSKGSARIEIRRGERRFFLTTSLATLIALASTDREPA